MVVKRFSSKLVAVGQEKLKTHTITAKDETKKKMLYKYSRTLEEEEENRISKFIN